MAEFDTHILILHFLGGIVFVWFALNLGDTLHYRAFSLRESFKPLTVLATFYFITFFMPLYLNRIIDDRDVLTFTPVLSFIAYTGGISAGNILWQERHKRGE